MVEDAYYTPKKLRQIKLAKRITIAVGVVVGCICAGALVLAYYHVRYERPAKELFMGAAAAGAGGGERAAPDTP